jgi:hypothetical protein
MAYSEEIRKQEEREMLSTKLFWDGVREKSHSKVAEGLMLLKAFINYMENHFGEDPSYDYSNALRITRENLFEMEEQLRKEAWY